MCKSLDWQMSVWQKSDGQKSFDKYEMAKVGLAKTGNHQDVANAKLLKIAILAQNRRFDAKSRKKGEKRGSWWQQSKIRKAREAISVPYLWKVLHSKGVAGKNLLVGLCVAMMTS